MIRPDAGGTEGNEVSGSQLASRALLISPDTSRGDARWIIVGLLGR